MFWNKKSENEHIATIEALKKELQRVEDNKNQAVKNAEAIEKERDELKKMVREQNKADLFLVSFKIVEKMKEGRPREDKILSSLQSEQQRLLAAQQRIGSYATYPTQGFVGSLYPYYL